MPYSETVFTPQLQPVQEKTLPSPSGSQLRMKGGLVLLGKKGCGSPQSEHAVLMINVCISTGFVKGISGRGLRKRGCQ